MRKEYGFQKATRGPVGPISHGRTRITIRLDNEVIAWFKDRVRRVLREELQHSG